jgi:AAA15 family ATPase/GTPase
MNDERLLSLEVAEPANEYGSSLRISKIKLVNYKFFYGEFELPVDGENLLLYGENGSGKSSIYKALELLTREKIENLGQSRNIFSESGDIEIEFGFTNGTELTITEDIEVLPDYVDFLKALSVFKPMLDYKKLLKVHYTEKTGTKRINLYGMFRQLLRDFPIDSETVLSGIKDLNQYFTELKKVVDGKLLEDINHLIQDYFDADIRIDSFEYRTEINDETGGAEPIVNMIIDFKDNQIKEYLHF